MKFKKIFLFILIFILLGTLTLTGFANEENNLDEIEDYIYKVYEKYQENEFEEVYNNMHPEIREVLDKETYIKFQEKTTSKYNIEYSEVEVLKVTTLEKWPDAFEDIITDKENNGLYEITIKYKTNYKNAGVKQEKIIERETYAVNYKSQNYLLWDPNVINKD